jgi:hypothetical protein
MRKLLVGSFLFVGLVSVAATANGVAVMVPQKPAPTRAALTDAIVIGRVMGLEDVDVKVAVAPGSPQMTTYRIAVVSIADVVRGKKEMKQVRVGFVPVNVGPGVNPGGPGPIGRPGFGPVQLAAGQDGLFFLQKHPTGDFYIVNGQFDFVPSQNKAMFDNDLKDAQRAGKLLDDPMAGLKSKDANDRYFTAALLITQYRTPRVFPNKQEPISVEESKLILQALAESHNWKGQGFMPGPGPIGPPIKGGPALPPGGGVQPVPAPGGAVPPQPPGGGVQPAPVQGGGAQAGVGQAGPGQVVQAQPVQVQPVQGGPVKGGPIKGGPRPLFDPMAPMQLFNMLGVTQQDGFMPPAKITSPDDYPNAAREWCQKNAGTYQIKRFVSAK